MLQIIGLGKEGNFFRTHYLRNHAVNLLYPLYLGVPVQWNEDNA